MMKGLHKLLPAMAIIVLSCGLSGCVMPVETHHHHHDRHNDYGQHHMGPPPASTPGNQHMGPPRLR